MPGENVMRILLFLGLLFGWGSVNAGDVLLKCVNKNGTVTFTKTIRKGESCTPLLEKQSSDFEVPPVKEERASGPNFVLMCQEIEFTVFLGPSEKWTKGQRDLFDYQTRRNESPKRPYFAVKYLDNKLSYNNQGAVWLNNDTLGLPNDLGWFGRIAIQEDSIVLELKNTSTTSPIMRTLLQIDRYTGLYKAWSFSPGEEEADWVAKGKCEKYDQKLF